MTEQESRRGKSRRERVEFARSRDILDVANNIDFSQWVKEKLREKLKKELD